MASGYQCDFESGPVRIEAIGADKVRVTQAGVATDQAGTFTQTRTMMFLDLEIDGDPLMLVATSEGVTLERRNEGLRVDRVRMWQCEADRDS